MTVSYISSAFAYAASGLPTVSETLSMPTHAAGDLIVGFAFRDGNNTPYPAVPSGENWSALDQGGGTGLGGISIATTSFYKIAASSSENFGTATDATGVQVVVYRSDTGSINIGAHAMNWNTSVGTGSDVLYAALTLTNSPSWVAAQVGHRRTDTSLETPPTGMTLRENPRAGGSSEGGIFDTNGTVASWSNQTVTVGGTTTGNGWVVQMYEIVEGASTQTITPALFTNTNTFYDATISTLTTITPALFTNSNSFFGATISQTGPGTQNIDTALFTNSNSFFAATISQFSAPQSITAARHNNTNTFFGAEVANPGIPAPGGGGSGYDIIRRRRLN